jgi:hypothetical protein
MEVFMSAGSVGAGIDQGKGAKPEQEINIIVNARPKKVTEERQSFDDILNLAYDGNPQPGPFIVFTVTYRNAESDPRNGAMEAGDIVVVRNGTNFNVTRTDKS